MSAGVTQPGPDSADADLSEATSSASVPVQTQQQNLIRHLSAGLRDQPVTPFDNWQAPIIAMQVNAPSDACGVALENPISCRSLAKRQEIVV